MRWEYAATCVQISLHPRWKTSHCTYDCPILRLYFSKPSSGLRCASRARPCPRLALRRGQKEHVTLSISYDTVRTPHCARKKKKKSGNTRNDGVKNAIINSNKTTTRSRAMPPAGKRSINPNNRTLKRTTIKHYIPVA